MKKVGESVGRWFKSTEAHISPGFLSCRGPLVLLKEEEKATGALEKRNGRCWLTFVRLIRPRCEQPRGRTGELGQWPLQKVSLE